jgi:hypothetical protein
MLCQEDGAEWLGKLFRAGLQELQRTQVCAIQQLNDLNMW